MGQEGGSPTLTFPHAGAGAGTVAIPPQSPPRVTAPALVSIIPQLHAVCSCRQHIYLHLSSTL